MNNCPDDPYEEADVSFDPENEDWDWCEMEDYADPEQEEYGLAWEDAMLAIEDDLDDEEEDWIDEWCYEEDEEEMW